MAVSQDFIVNSTALGVSYSPFAPTVATLADGRALVAWVSVTPDNYGSYHVAEIRGRWFNADGTPSGDDFVINTTLESYQWWPSAAATADGKVVVSWVSGEGSGLRGIVLDPDAAIPTADFELNLVTPGFEGQFSNTAPEVTALSDGRFFVVWTSNDGADGDAFCVQGRFFDAGGTALGGNLVLNTTATGNQYDADVTELSDGRILVAFSSYLDGSATGGGVLARMINADGSLAGQDVQINTATEGYQMAVDVAALTDGRAVAVWFCSGPIVQDTEGGNPSVGPSSIRAQVIGADGQPAGADFAVNATDLGYHYGYPAITALAGGGALVVWHSGDAGDGDWGCLRGRLLNADGQPVSQDFVINSTLMNNQSSPALEAFADGRVLVTWSSDEGSGAGAVTRGLWITPTLGDGGDDTLTGGMGSDMMMGLAGADRLNAGQGADMQMGGSGRDSLSGGRGDDLMQGGVGVDRLIGGEGSDTMTGGQGADRFVFGAADLTGQGDVITDMTGQDQIDLSRIDANDQTGGNDTFDFIGGAGFSAAGQLRFSAGLLQGDVDGDGAADFTLQLSGVTSLAGMDILF